ncbi:hypothetical protein GCM10023216_00420 [Isoptericola chiayiensis]|uniref:Uncharacterized protein n=1 Tax=Isoptericola chiayiensis TaxID=579446 RepID=A0ABP8XZS8_9MICO
MHKLDGPVQQLLEAPRDGPGLGGGQRAGTRTEAQGWGAHPASLSQTGGGGTTRVPPSDGRHSERDVNAP